MNYARQYAARRVQIERLRRQLLPRAFPMMLLPVREAKRERGEGSYAHLPSDTEPMTG